MIDIKESASEFRTAIGDMNPKQQNDVTLVTQQGYLMLVKSLTDDLAWQVQRELVNHYFTPPAKPVTIMDLMETQMKAIQGVDQDLQDFKQDLPILGVEESRITYAVRKKGMECLGGKRSAAYQDRSIRSRVYSDIYKQLKREFGVDTYKAVKRNQCEHAIGVIEDYEMPYVLSEQVNRLNDQINI